MAETRIKTFCRLCEVNCGLEATLDDDQRISALRPDKAHPGCPSPRRIPA